MLHYPPMQISFSGKYWQLDDDQTKNNFYDLVDTLANKRGVTLAQQPLSSPNAFTQLPQAIARITQAIAQKEIIYIFGDYDCDGVTSIVQLCRFFQRRGISPIIDVPHRVRDGYGLQPHVVERIITSKSTLVITVDNGISSASEVEQLKAAGIDTIITDHHEVPTTAPKAVAVIHPALSTLPTNSPLAGAGVVHFLVRALEDDAQWPGRSYDEILAMIGTIGDIVPLTGDNRTISQIGLNALKKSTDTPIHTLCALLERDSKTLTSSDISFGIVPPINAVGRIGEPVVAIKALLNDKQSLKALVQSNAERKEITESLMQEIEHICKKEAHKHIIAYKNNAVAPGIIGLLAGKITERTGKPSLVATNTDGICTASLRSTPRYNIMSGLHACSDSLLRYGGHNQAAGFSCNESAWSTICSTLERAISTTVSLEELRPIVQIDTKITPTLLTLRTIAHLQQLEPFGQHNNEPCFLLENVLLTDIRPIGKDNSHLQAKIDTVKAIGFGLAEHALRCKTPVNVVCTLQKNYWNGSSTVQIRIIDIGPCSLK